MSVQSDFIFRLTGVIVLAPILSLQALAVGAATDVVDGDLILAILANNRERLVSLLDQGADVNATDCEGDTPLIIAACRQRLDMVNLLKDRGAALSVRAAACLGDVESVKRLVREGADVNAHNKRGLTTLMGAAVRGDPEIIKALIDLGAEVNMKDLIGQTALIYAFMGGLFGEDKEENPSLKFNAEASMEIVNLLLSKGAKIDEKNKLNASLALYWAAKMNRLDLVKLLLEQGFEVNGDPMNMTGVVDSGHPDVLRLLLDHGANVNGGDQLSQTPLMRAAFKGHLEMARLLLDSGADIDAGAAAGGTALMNAVGEGHLEVVRLLLDKGADMNVRAHCMGWTALGIAKDYKHKEIEELLRSRGAQE
jgi:uncharacterized protein